ncbi:ribonucleoside-diphosphate reductase subunit alpha, partial [Cytobacillus firmus]
MVQTIQPIEILEELKTEFPQLGFEQLLKRYEEMSQQRAEAIYDQLILDCLSFISIEEPDWTFAASRLLLKKLYIESGKNRACEPDDCYT